MSRLDASSALTAIQEARHFARAKGWAPMALVALDASGLIVAALRDDGAGICGIEIATAKAKAALALGASSRTVGEMFEGRSDLVASLNGVMGGAFLPLPGAVLLHSHGSVVGALAAAGGLPDQDEATVIAGAENVSLFSNDKRPG